MNTGQKTCPMIAIYFPWPICPVRVQTRSRLQLCDSKGYVAASKDANRAYISGV